MTLRSLCLALLLVSGACERRDRSAPTPPGPVPVEDARVTEATDAAAAAAAPDAPVISDAGDPVATAPDAGGKPAPDPRPARPDAGEPAKGGGAGDGKCGGIAGFRCKDGEKCRYAKGKFAPQYPDAMGACVAETYCDAPKDCEGLIDPMVVGAWACQRQTCAWKAEGAP